MQHFSAGIVLLVAIVCCRSVAHAQASPPESPSPTQPPPDIASPVPVVIQTNAAVPCVQPAPLVSWQDYQGPFAKVVGAFGRKVERKSVHPPRYKSGKLLCTFTLKSKFRLAAEDMVDPFTILNIGFNAGISQADSDDRTFGQGAAGYGKRFAAAAADQASGDFFKFIVYPTVFSEDPRYYRLAEGTGKLRLAHALEHAVIAHKEEDGRQMFNFSEWLGTASTVVLSNMYHPGNKPGVGPAAEGVGINIATDVGFDVLREFWPEIAKKFRLPFHDQNEPKS